MARPINQIIAHIRAVVANPSVSATLIQTEDLEALCAATETIRRAAIEECAKVADQEATARKSEIGCDPYAKARVIVVAHCIRALAQQPPAGEKKR